MSDTNTRVTRKQIEAEFPRFKVVNHPNGKGYSVLFKEWNVMNCCILGNMKLDAIRRFVKDQNEEFDRSGTLRRAYFRKD